MTDIKKKFEEHIRSSGGEYNLFKVGDVYIDVETQIEWRTWQKAWQAALASQDDGWIEWAGGECPVADNRVVRVRYRGDFQEDKCIAGSMIWNHSGEEDDIVAYRVVKP